MAYVSIPSLLGPTLGPLVGGAITTYWSWRWIFYVNIPVGVVAILIAGRAVENFRSGTRTSFDFTGFLLSGIGLALLQFFLETVGRGEIGAAWVAALLVGGVALMLVYRWHARRHANAVLDLSLFSIRTFRIGSLAGGLSRVAINAPPFLLPLLFQVGFGLSPVQSGLLTFVSSLGAFAVKPVSASLLRLMGFDRLLVVNSIVSAAAIAGFAAFHAGTPHWFVLAYIMTFGVVRTTQFNAVQMLSYADVPRSRLSRATSLGSVVQQLTMGLGVSVSAALLNMLAGSGQNVTAADFSNVFLVLGVLPLLAIPGFLALRPDDGVEVSRHQRARPRAAE
jgi:MFS family permease